MTNILKCSVDDVFGDVEGFYSFITSPIITIILRNGGYVAGGCPRSFLALGCVNLAYFTSTTYAHRLLPDESCPQRRSPGDVDIFFRSKDGFEAAKSDIDRLIDNMGGLHGRTSLAGFAFDYMTPLQAVTRCNVPNTVKVQLVSSWFGEPIHVIDTFDFTNSKVGFDATHAYVSDDWRRVHDASILDVQNCRPHDLMTGARIAKYVRRGYTNLSRSTVTTFIGWVQHHAEQLVNVSYHPFSCVPGNAFRMPSIGRSIIDVVGSSELNDDELIELAGFIDDIKVIKDEHGSYENVEYRVDDLIVDLLQTKNANPALLSYASSLSSERRKVHQFMTHRTAFTRST